MRCSFLTSATALLAFASSSSALNIILNNDDGWASANIRAMYHALRNAGHNAWIVAPVENQSGKGGTSDWSTEPTLSQDGQYGSVAAGSLSYGSDPADSHIWYYNGTPAACSIFALDWVVKKYWNGTTPDLFVTGPNEGQNLGGFVFTLAGTLGAAYTAVDRGYPAIAFSADSENGSLRPYTEVNMSNSSDPAVVFGNLGVKLISQLESTASSGALLPNAYGLNVNFPTLTDTCTNPPYIQSRLTGGAEVDSAVFNETTGLFTWGSVYPSDGIGLNTCVNGQCSLPGESRVVKTCRSSVSVFTVDYDAPSTQCGGSKNVRQRLLPLVSYFNGTGSSTTNSSSPNSTYSAYPSVPVETGAAMHLASSFIVQFLPIIASCFWML